MKVNTFSAFFKSLKDCLLGKDFYDSNKQEMLSKIRADGYSVAVIHSFLSKNKITTFEKRLFQITTWLLVLAFFPLFTSFISLIYPLMPYFVLFMLWYPLYLLPFTLRVQRLFFIFAVWLCAFWFEIFSFYLSIIPSIFGFNEIIFDKRILMGSELFYQFFDLSFDKLWIVFIALMIPLTILTLVSYRRISFALIFVLITTAVFWYFQEFSDKLYRHSTLREYSYDYLDNKVKLGDIKGYQRKIKHLELGENQGYDAIKRIQPTEIYYYNKLYNKENKCVRDFFVNETNGRGYKNNFIPSIGMAYCDLISSVPWNPLLLKSKAVNARKRQAENMMQQRSGGEFCISYYDYVIKKAKRECSK